MELTALFTLLMLGFTLLNSCTRKSDAAFLRITPNRLQHFQLDTVSFHCEGSGGLSKLRVIRNTKEIEPECDIKTPTGSCTIERIYESDSGEYWCETGGGERSSRANITVTDGPVVLQSPVLPVMEGDNVTLSCRNKNNLTNLPADFIKDGRLSMKSSLSEVTVKNVSKSHEGLYKCSIDGVGESPESRLTVRELRRGAPDSPKVLFLLWIAVTVLMLALVLLLVGLLHVKNRRASSKASAAHSVCVDAADDPDGVTYAVVVMKPRQKKDAADSAENKSPESNQSTKPQREEDDNESSFQPVYSALTISETPQVVQQEESGPSSPTVTLNPTAATDSTSAEQEVLYAPVQKAKKSKDC